MPNVVDSNVNFYSGTASDLASATKEEGSFYYTDDGKLYHCDGTKFNELTPTVLTGTVDIDKANWSTTAPYSNVITIPEDNALRGKITTSSAILTDVAIDKSSSEVEELLNAWSCISTIEITDNNQLTLHAYKELKTTFKMSITLLGNSNV